MYDGSCWNRRWTFAEQLFFYYLASGGNGVVLLVHLNDDNLQELLTAFCPLLLCLGQWINKRQQLRRQTGIEEVPHALKRRDLALSVAVEKFCNSYFYSRTDN